MLSTKTSASAASQSPVTSTSMTTTTTAATGTSQTESNQELLFRLESCSPRSLVDALVCARGREEASRILQEAAALVVGDNAKDAKLVSPDEKQPRSSSTSPGVTVENNTTKTASTGNNDPKLLGRPLLSQPIETSFLSPRMGKFSVQLFENGMLASKTNDPSVQFQLGKEDLASASASGVSHVLLFPKPEDCKAIVYNRKLDADSKPKKVGGNLVVLRLASPLQVPKQKSPTQQLCFALPADKKLGTPTGPSLIEDDLSTSSDPTEAWGQLLHRALGGRLAQVLGRTPSDAFTSYQPPNTSTTTAGMPFVSCYLGVNDGVLYPLEEGLLFYKPPRFLPRSNLHSIACGRGGGGVDSSSRYVDMVVQCSGNDSSDKKDGEDASMETVEFTNIQREENTVLNSYIHDILVPAMTRDANERSKQLDSSDDSDEVAVEAIAEEDIDDDATEDDDDDDHPVEEVSDGESDSDDDEDFQDAESRESGSESDDSSDDDIDYGEDDEGIAVVRDDFAQELVNEKRRKNEEESATESEDDDSSSGRPRFSKRLRRAGA